MVADYVDRRIVFFILRILRILALGFGGNGCRIAIDIDSAAQNRAVAVGVYAAYDIDLNLRLLSLGNIVLVLGEVNRLA